MKYTLKRAIIVCMCVVLAFGTVAFAFAVDKSDTSIQVTITTDKENYFATSTAKVMVRVENKSGKILNNVVIFAMADNWLLAKGSHPNVLEVGSLNKDDTQTLSFSAVLNRKANGVSFLIRPFLFLQQLFNKPSAFVSYSNTDGNGTVVTKAVKHGGATVNIIATVWHDSNESSFDIVKDFDGEIIALEGNYSNDSIDSFDDAINSLNDIKHTLGIDNPRNEYEPSIHNSTDVSETYVLQQIYKDIPVYARTISISVNKQGEPYLLNSSYKPNINVSTTPRKTESQILELLNANNNSDYSYTVDGLTIFSLYDYEDSPVLAYAVNAKQNDICVEKIFVDADNGSVVYADSSLKTLTADAKDELGKTRTIPVQLSGGKYTLYDPDRYIKPYNTSNENETPYSNSTNLWGDKTAVSSYANIIYAFDWYNSKLRLWGNDNTIVNPLRQNGLIKIYAHFPYESDNAAWCGNNIFVFCDNGLISSNTTTAACLDVCVHEFTHGMVEHVVGDLPYSNATGAINEAYADIMACIATGDWTVGEEWVGNKGIRNIADPYTPVSYQTVLGVYTDDPYPIKYLSDEYWHDYDDSADHGGVHTNCVVLSHAAYFMNKNGISYDDLAKLWYVSMTEGYDGDSEFENVRINVENAAKRLNFSNKQKGIIANAFDYANILLNGSKYPSTPIFDGEYVYYGLYPQSHVTDSSLINELNSLICEEDWYCGNPIPGILFDEKNNRIDTDVKEYLQYADVAYKGEKYRAVSYKYYFGWYYFNFLYQQTFDSDTGYDANKVYWFKYEPIRWRVLDVNTGLIMSEAVLDNQPYDYYGDDYPSTIFWPDVSIRDWLNNDFYSREYFDFDYQFVLTSTVTTVIEEYDDEIDQTKIVRSTSNDNVFLLSYEEAHDSKYGFKEDSDMDDLSRAAWPSDFARLHHARGVEEGDACLWRTREGYIINDYSSIWAFAGESRVARGIRPVMRIDYSFSSFA